MSLGYCAHCSAPSATVITERRIDSSILELATIRQLYLFVVQCATFFPFFPFSFSSFPWAPKASPATKYSTATYTITSRHCISIERERERQWAVTKSPKTHSSFSGSDIMKPCKLVPAAAAAVQIHHQISGAFVWCPLVCVLVARATTNTAMCNSLAAGKLDQNFKFLLAFALCICVCVNSVNAHRKKDTNTAAD